MCSHKVFPDAFKCYRPYTEKVFGSICITPQNKILLVKGRRSGKWSFPKGHKQYGETYLECARRETLEETGIDLSSYIPVAIHRLSIGEYYFYEIEEQRPCINDTREIVDVRWMSLSELRSSRCNVDISAFLSRLKRSMDIFSNRY
jgi:8-oxo-dGTP pyrophosphatase MutT (NUDIX family)